MMNQKLQGMLAVAVLGALILSGVAAHAGDPVAGRARAGMCVTCHGPLGLSQAPNAPNLAAQPAIYIVAQLLSFRNGKRQHEVMNVIAKTLTDREIDDLAAWYASIQISVTAQ